MIYIPWDTIYYFKSLVRMEDTLKWNLKTIISLIDSAYVGYWLKGCWRQGMNDKLQHHMKFPS